MARISCGKVQWLSAERVLELLECCPEALREALTALCAEAPEADIPLAQYEYGDLLVNEGEFCPPCDRRGCVDCARLLAQVDYAPIPLALIAEHAVEVFLDSPWDMKQRRQIPMRVIDRGEIFGVFETLDHILKSPTVKPPWNVSAGVRSVWVVAPLGNEDLVKSLTNGSRTWSEDKDPHWKLVREVTAKSAEWRTRILVLPKALLEVIARGRGERAFTAMLRTAWSQSAALRNAAVEDASLHEHVSQPIAAFGTQFGAIYDYSTIRHWLNILSGSMPAYQAASRFKESGGPFREFCEALGTAMETQNQRGKLKAPYKPVILRPGLLGAAGEAGLISFRCPSVPGPAPKIPDTFASIPFSYQTLLKEIQHAWAEQLREPHVQYFVQPRPGPDRRPPAAGRYADEMPLEGILGNGRADQIFWNSPFFVAGAKLTRRAESGLSRGASASAR